MGDVEWSRLKQSLQNPSRLLSLLRHESSNPNKKPKSWSSKSNTFLKLFKVLPLLSSGCKVAAMLAAGGSKQYRRAMIADHATIGTLFGHRRGRITLAVQDDPHSLPYFVVELPIHSTAFNKEMSCDVLRIAFETQTKTHKKNLTDELVWAVYCNGRKVGYSVRRTQLSDDEERVLHTLRGVSMGAGVLPDHHGGITADKGDAQADQITYVRARFERVVGSKDSQALYMINPDNADGPELSIFFLRVR